MCPVGHAQGMESSDVVFEGLAQTPVGWASLPTRERSSRHLHAYRTETPATLDKCRRELRSRVGREARARREGGVDGSRK